MIFSSFIPTRWRRNYDITDPNKPGFYNRRVTPYLQAVSRKACVHPLYTIAFVVIIASGFYANLLETGFFQPSPASVGNKVDFHAIAAGRRQLSLGPETAWKWQLKENGHARKTQQDEEDIALVTLAFPESGANGSPNAAPSAKDISVAEGSSVELLPSSAHMLASMSADSSLTYSMPYSHSSKFFESVKELPTSGDETVEADDGSDDEQERKRWIMKNGKKAGGSGGILQWFQDSWASFMDLLNNAETLDIIIMSLGYLSMYLTFISLFVSMRRLGSNFWLGTTVLFSSAFAFLFGIVVTMHLGVPENLVLLSEGVPFLVVTVGFEKPIVLTQAVLSASVAAKANGNGNGDAGLTIQNAVQYAVRERGFEIVRDYFIEILILCIGAASGIQGGLRQFCFLAAWTLFFDCILLFTFYTSILTIKLEINRIKRHVALRKALEEDGVSRRVAENVASSNEWPKDDICSHNNDWSIFGRKVKDGSVPRFKVLMVSGFILINVLNLCSLPFRGSRNNSPVAMTGLSSVVSQPPMDPFKVAGSGLDYLFEQAKKNSQPISVTVFNPIKYELQFPGAAAVEQDSEWSLLNGDYTEGLLFSAVGGRVVESLLKSFEDPVLSKWVIIALAMSLVLNGYLFNAARWTIKEPEHDQPSSQSTASEHREHQGRPQSHMNGHPVGPANRVDDESSASLDGLVSSSTGGESRKRTREECEAMLKDKQAPLLDDSELIDLSLRGKIPGYALEKTLEDKTRAVKVRRSVISRTPATMELTHKLEKSKLPYEHFDYDRVHGACCENVIGYLPLPLGVAGPMTIDGRSYFLPMATTEGVLVASTSRGAKAINAGGGAVTVLTGDGMTRGPCIGFQTLTRAAAAKLWLDSHEGQKTMKDAFNSTSRFARLQSLKTAIAGTYVYVRFKTTTGDAMGMNMISKGVEHSLKVMSEEAGFEDMAIITVSGNYCTDKKPAAINWIDGRGKSVVAEAIIPAEVVRTVLKSDVNALVELNISKNFIGSAMAGSIGGFNAHAANIVTAIFLATGQDPAQNVESSNCITVMKNLNGNLQISVSMPSIEVGTIGGGTVLEPQAAMLDLLGVRGAHATTPGDNARQLARIVAAGVLAGELSLCSALAAGHLVKAHMSHNRSAAPSRAQSPGTGARTGGAQTPVGLTMTNMVEKAGEQVKR
ncbi:3-hydroxy-3-methylglutaryl-coenzyme A (HMG-CoA) reductase isozyme [Vermiconidia calcicola]|uniref:3-hydroxy-3-methylglutaryl-coenzyme A (HMG-CoA) reductase isozyme n=1 Tax=Vermiconidia calcicola TaxID=1690605 RepID=A0ACC3MXH9_9PEZI|nr:3-hydroxy-3-methylglutaryl-coenzyme A (HMG-CoA) reductase isozyme [Vermiconidia calcicola]